MHKEVYETGQIPLCTLPYYSAFPIDILIRLGISKPHLIYRDGLLFSHSRPFLYARKQNGKKLFSKTCTNRHYYPKPPVDENDHTDVTKMPIFRDFSIRVFIKLKMQINISSYFRRFSLCSIYEFYS